MRIANVEYQELKTELKKLQEKLEVSREGLSAMQKGDGRAGLELEMARLEGKDKRIEERMCRWLAIVEECVKGLHEGPKPW